MGLNEYKKDPGNRWTRLLTKSYNVKMAPKKKPKNQFTIYETRTHLSQILKRVEKGEEMLIANGSRVVAKLVPAVAAPETRQPGSARGEFKVAEDFDAPLPKNFLKNFEK